MCEIATDRPGALYRGPGQGGKNEGEVSGPVWNKLLFCTYPFIQKKLHASVPSLNDESYLCSLSPFLFS